MTALSPGEARSYERLGEQAHVPILFRAIAPLLGDLRDRSVLDFGCGEGRRPAATPSSLADHCSGA